MLHYCACAVGNYWLGKTEGGAQSSCERAESCNKRCSNTGALGWQGAMTHRLEIGAGLGKKIRTDGGRGRHLSNGRDTVSDRFLVGRGVL